MSDLNYWFPFLLKFPWAIVFIIVIISLTSLKVLMVFKKNKSMTSAECGNPLFKIKLKREDHLNGTVTKTTKTKKK
jgi:hypothetical protein